MTAQFIEIAGQRMAVLPAAEFEQLLELVEDKADAAAAVAAEARRAAGEEYVPAVLVDRLLAGEAPLKVWREHRNLSVAQLAEASGVDRAIVARLEGGADGGSLRDTLALTAALRITVEDLQP
jgi:DNA-binding XRE family transcriptional regulator